MLVKALFLSALLAVPASAAKAPDLVLPVLLQAPTPKLGGLAELKGKVVFLEYWATWCVPCVAGFPKTNRLIDSLKGEPVVFIAVTDEDPKKIEAFLKKREFKGWIGVDESGKSLKDYGVTGRPEGFLIGKDGNLLAKVSPESLKLADVREALAGTFKPRPVSLAKAVNEPGPRPGAAALYFEATISSAVPGEGGGMRYGGGTLEAKNLPFAFVVSWIWDVQQQQVIAEDPPVEKLSLRLKTPPESFEEGREMLKYALRSAFGVDVSAEKIEKEALVLKRVKGKAAPRVPGPGDSDIKAGAMSMGNGRYLGRTGTGELARGLWMALRTPVLDETKLEGEYLFDLDWDDSGRPGLDKALAEIGLELVPARRKIEHLRVTKRAKAAKP